MDTVFVEWTALWLCACLRVFEALGLLAVEENSS